MTRPGLLRTLCAVGAAFAIGAVGLTASPVSAAGAVSCSSGAAQRVIVRAAGDVVAARRATLEAGGRVISTQSGLGMLVADVPCASVLEASVAVAAVDADFRVHKMSLGSDAAGQPGSMSTVVDAIGARDLWKKGFTGKGVDIAVVDTGIAPVGGLAAPGKLALGPDLSVESQAPNLRHLDTYGHGTHIAGIAAGREGPAATGPVYAEDTANFYGVAPDARIVSLKVGDHSGTVDVSQVIAAIDWVVTHKGGDGLNVRVLNLSYGTPSLQSPQLDPLSFAVEAAVKRGIVVVTSAGNDGAERQGLSNPAHDSNVIAVGAVDMRGTATATDDTVAGFSARAGGVANPDRAPDVLAPGVSIVSLKVPGSTIAQAHPSAAVGQLGIRGSGTSQAAGVVSGAVALLLQQRPDLQPPQVQDLLRSSARKLTGVIASVQGSGELNLTAAAAAPYPMWATQTSTSTGLGTIEAARGGIHVVNNNVSLSGEKDLLGKPWNGVAMRGLTEGGITWQGGQWNSGNWASANWLGNTTDPGASWDGMTWGGLTWGGLTWGGMTWGGMTWGGLTWGGGTWTNNGWSSQTWTSSFGLTGLSTSLWATKAWG